ETTESIFASNLRQRDAERSGIGHEDAELSRSSHRRIEEVPREHDEVGGKQRDDDPRILAALTFVDARRVSERQEVQVSFFVLDLSFVEANEQTRLGGLHPGDDAEIAV